MIEEVRKQVYELLAEDHTGHGTEHVDRVLNLSLKFAEKEKADPERTALIALLHDVDDYKLFGMESAEKCTHARNILQSCGFSEEMIEQVINDIKTIGFSKRLKGICPATLEGKIVSDADMCDSMGITGILRSFQYNLSRNRVFFDKDIMPELNLSAEDYMTKKDGTVITHMFEKLLKLKDLMLTDSGKNEAMKRHQVMIDFLYHFFEEENALDWIDFLNRYLNETGC